MKAYKVSELVSDYRQANAGFRPLALKLCAAGERLLVSWLGLETTTMTQDQRRSFIERCVKIEKPSGLESVIWNQDITEACMQIPV